MSLNIVGLPDAAVREARERVRFAMRNAVFEFPLRRSTVNLAPADVRRQRPLEDLPIAFTTNTRLARGNRAPMIGGGRSVRAAGTIARVGVDPPELDEDTTVQLRELMPVAANSIRKPIDPSHFRGGDERAEPYRRLIEIDAHAAGIDVRLVMTGGPPDFAPPGAEEQRDPDDVRPAASAGARPSAARTRGGSSSRTPAATRRSACAARASLPAPADDLLGIACTHSLGILPTVPARPARSPG